MKNLLIVREIEHNGIKVLVQIDLARRRASLVEVDPAGGYRPKRWLFAERTPGYLESWLTIFDAMKEATSVAMSEIVAIQEEDFDKAIDLFEQLDKRSKT